MNRLNLITLGVIDMVESLASYREGLGLEIVVYGDETNPDVMFFNNGGTKISLFPIERLVKDIN
ncbi:VOC family protein, partial [Lysinibacillus fusiformis]|uniref:VOC family protein n=1 Tax=Lysinibacillus fusiformis TaxID=28031 RepID=UPI0020C0E081